MSDLQGSRIHITGIVQGVGFRPFVYGLARRLELTGWVRNTSAGVDIEVDGTRDALEAFVRALKEEAPPLSTIDTLKVLERPPDGFDTFEIIRSEPQPGAFQPISPDVSLCPDCLRELYDPEDLRHRYPFINCTNCGPRFTIIQDVPYDRPKTTMAPFEMCADCAAEYHDPTDRRFHAQPVACPECGPHIWLEKQGTKEQGDAALLTARQLLAAGEIIAIKGLGGFHLACDATNSEAVAELRRRKLRVDKPFAIMMADLETASRHCFVGEGESELLQSRARPIVILNRRPTSPIAAGVAPNQNTLGVMLPYTPLHHLLLEREAGFPEALVMTSGNLSEEPIAYTNADARKRLAPLADAFLLNNRDIHVRCDDSVMRVVGGLGDAMEPTSERPYPLRRSRGYAPFPVQLPWKAPPLIATGAELKNTFCLVRDSYAFLSHHIGDMENLETLTSFREGIDHFEQLFRVQPEILAYDLHPDYLATRYALARAEREGLPAIGVQHHHAHVAACMAENSLPQETTVIGVSFDGTGYGEDGAVWGGEFLLAGYADFQRLYHLAYVPLPGGDKAVREPWRMALAWLHHAGIDWGEDLPPMQYALRNTPPDHLEILHHQIQTGLALPTSSMGRLFDAVSALVGVCQTVNYEAQAAIELEARIVPDESGRYPLEIESGVIDPAPMLESMVRELRHGEPPETIAAKFHNAVAWMVLEACRKIRAQSGCSAVALSGGVWQNVALLKRSLPLLRDDSFSVHLHSEVPANDGGLALGQAAIGSVRYLHEGDKDVFRHPW